MIATTFRQSYIKVMTDCIPSFLVNTEQLFWLRVRSDVCCLEKREFEIDQMVQSTLQSEN